MIDRIQVISPYYGVLENTGGPVILTQGDILRVSVSFKYSSPHKASRATLRGIIGTLSQRAAEATLHIDLPISEGFITKNASIDIPTSSGGTFSSGTAPGVYNLTVMIDEDPTVYDEIPSCITVVKQLGMLDMIIPLMIIGMMAMMMPMIMPKSEREETHG